MSADADNLDTQIAAEYRRMATQFRAFAAMRREEAEKVDSPTRQHQLLEGADTWERSALYFDAKVRVFAFSELRRLHY